MNGILAKRFEELAQLKAGWLDGAGMQPDAEKLEAVARKMIEGYPDCLLLPFIVPTPDGNLLLEWNVSGDPTVDLDMSGMDATFHVFNENDEDHTETFSLRDDAGFDSFFAFLSSLGQLRSSDSTSYSLSGFSTYEIITERLKSIKDGTASSVHIEALMREHGIED